MAKRSVAHALEVKKSKQKKRFFKAVSELRESKKTAERRRLKKKLACITFGE